MNDTATLEPEVLPASTDVSTLADASANKPALWESERQQVAKFTASVNAILAPSDNPELQAKLARTTRLEIKPVRIAVEKMRKEFNEESQAKIKACNALAKQITDVCVDMEDKLLGVEQYAERAEAARILKMTEDRTAALAAVGAMAPANVGSLTDEIFAAILADATELQRLKQDREAKAEAERIAKIEAERLERIRIEEENARLKAEAEETARLAKIESDRIAAERAEDARKAKESADKRAAEFAAERAKQEEAARIERDKLEFARREAEAEAAKARKATAEAQAKIDAAKAEEIRIAREEAAAKAKAAKAPDKEKLVAWLASFKSLALPEMATTDGEHALASIRTALNRVHAEIKATIDAL